MRHALRRSAPFSFGMVSGCSLLALASLGAPLLAQPPANGAPPFTPAADTPTPPAQPLTGPGGTQLTHASVLRHRYGVGNEEYWIYEPLAPQPTRAPVVVFMHGWGATNPQTYGAWIDHLVRRGNIVIYPRYQAEVGTDRAVFTPNSLAAIKSAISRLQTEAGHVRPDLNKFAIVGHSVGGLLSANIAALAQENGLPQFKAVMPTEPGLTSLGEGQAGQAFVKLEDLSKIPASTLLVCLAGDDDSIVGTRDALRIFRESTRIKEGNKNYVVLPSDSHGRPTLVADHFAPCANDARYSSNEPNVLDGNLGDVLGRKPASPTPRPEPSAIIPPATPQNTVSSGPRATNIFGIFGGVNALDYKMWSLFDALCDAAFSGQNRVYALGNTPEQRSLGQWSDGTPVKALQVVTRPS